MRLRTAVLTVAFALGSLCVPLGSGAQQPARVPRIGFLSLYSRPQPVHEAFLQGLREFGYVEGRTIAIEYRWAGLNPDRLREAAAELARLPVDLIVTTGGNTPPLVAKNATRTIPIVFIVGDPVRSGLVASLAKPGGNLTGLSLQVTELNAKRLGLLKEAVPDVSRVAVLANPATPLRGPSLQEVEAAARVLGVQLRVLDARAPAEFESAFSAMTRERVGALLVLSDAMFYDQRRRIVDLAAKSRLPGTYHRREFAEAGGLMSYGTNLADIYRRLAIYVDKILKGAKPADLPVEQPTKFELVVNLKTARALGLTVPPSILLRADQVIQ